MADDHFSELCRQILVEVNKLTPKTQKQFVRLKIKVINEFKKKFPKISFKIPKNIDVLSIASSKDREKFGSLLGMKPVRSAAGITVIALMSDPYPCPHSMRAIGPCTYCPGGPGSPYGDVPQSYTGAEPSTRRAARVNYDPYMVVFNRLEHYIAMNKIPDKVDVIIQGGTFTFFPKAYQEYFVKFAFKAMNDFSELFFTKSHSIDHARFNHFFELPGNINEPLRMASIHAKLRYLKYLDLTNKKILTETAGLLFNLNDKRKQAKLNKILEKLKLENIGNAKKSENIFSNKDHSSIATEQNGGTIALNVIKNEPQQDANVRLIRAIQEKLRQEDRKNITIEEMHKINETAHVRCIGLTIETKSDFGKLYQGNEMLRLGCTRVELGIQSVYDNVLEITHRGNTVQDNIESIRILKDLGFKILAHYMPGLPETSRKEDFAGMVQLFENQDYRPDMLKIYPCMVMPGTKLYEQWKAGKFKPLSTKEAAKLIAEFKKYVPEYCRIMRVQRDIPTNVTSAGVDKTNLRQYVEEVVKKKKIKCRCIRCREIGRFFEKLGYEEDKLNPETFEKIVSSVILASKVNKSAQKNIKDKKNNTKDNDKRYKKFKNPAMFYKQLLKKTLRHERNIKPIKPSALKHKLMKNIKLVARHYHASDGNEFFISAEWNDYVLGFCRLRFPSQFLRAEITEESALIRELHIYGQQVPIGNENFGATIEGAFQHLGLGKQLLENAEIIAKTYHKKKLVVISGVGVREYYKKLGYKKEGVYMVKSV
ncbi:GNAT family N-acetyltransferase [Candidatus Woesearchaeota archaeon]|nr:GNAT family N-acetyltransferase [Candidatus Woesearchaeota archaeon]